MLLRKYLTGGRLEAVRLYETEDLWVEYRGGEA
jgi:hypothetical protein